MEKVQSNSIKKKIKDLNIRKITIIQPPPLDGFKGAVNRWLLPSVVFFSLFCVAEVLWGCESNLEIVTFTSFPTWFSL